MLPAYRLCGHYMLDLDTLGPLEVLPGLVSAAGQIHLLLAVEGTTTVLIDQVIAVDPHDLPLRLLK
jgi:hypothetical protein